MIYMTKKNKTKETHYQIEEICGEVVEVMCDEKLKKLNLELGVSAIGTPVIIFQDWTEEEKSKDFFTLHIKEAIALKSVIDNLIVDWHTHQLENAKDQDDAGYY